MNYENGVVVKGFFYFVSEGRFVKMSLHVEVS